MTKKQNELYKKRIQEMKNIANIIEALPISKNWVDRFTAIAFYRGWRKITDSKQKKLTNIANVDSPSVATIVEQKNTKLSLDKIEQIATTVTDEADRVKICVYLLNNSWENTQKNINLIIAAYENKVA